MNRDWGPLPGTLGCAFCNRCRVEGQGLEGSGQSHRQQPPGRHTLRQAGIAPKELVMHSQDRLSIRRGTRAQGHTIHH